MYDYIFTYKGEQYGSNFPITCIVTNPNGSIFGFMKSPECVSKDGEEFWYSEKLSVEMHRVTKFDDAESSLEFV